MPSTDVPLRSGVATRRPRQERRRRTPSGGEFPLCVATSVVTVRCGSCKTSIKGGGGARRPPTLAPRPAWPPAPPPATLEPQRPREAQSPLRPRSRAAEGTPPEDPRVTARDDAPWPPPLAKEAPTKGRGISSRRLVVPGRDAKLGRAARTSQGVACGAETSRAMGCLQRLVVLRAPRVLLRRRRRGRPCRSCTWEPCTYVASKAVTPRDSIAICAARVAQDDRRNVCLSG